MNQAIYVQHTMNGPEQRGSVDLARRDFLKVCMGLAAVAGWTSCGPLLSRTRFSKLLLTDPAPAEYRPILMALLGTVLPFEDPRFPISPRAMLARFESMFSMETEERLIPLQRGLMVFNETELFSHALGPVREEERLALEGYPGNTREEVELQLEKKRLLDGKLLAGFLTKQSIEAVSFLEMAPIQRQAYFWIWSQSAFLLKRQFYRTAKAVILISAYSAPELWKSIGYKGPLLERG
jgi:hypothetical protein